MTKTTSVSSLNNPNKVFKLIKEIEQQSLLWDTNHDYFKNQTYRNAAWNKVAANVYSKWGEYSAKQRTVKCRELKKRWTAVRNSFRRFLNRLLSAPEGTVNKYLYMDVLEFIIPFLTLNNKSASEESVSQTLAEKLQYIRESSVVDLSECQDDTCDDTTDDDDDSDSSDGIHDENEVDTTQNESAIVKVDDSKDPFDGVDDKKLVQTKHKIGQPTIIEVQFPKFENYSSKRRKVEDGIVIKGNVNEHNVNLNDECFDEDVQFLLSFRSDMRLMNRTQKLQFKLGLIKLVQRVMDDGGKEMPCSSS